ncbi:DUF3253 domain-containing protein [Caulobacter sp. NIBR2454]|uniref:DUF3253 domain-containing protein n=1 Tax=Caulobacter sp. NIBR2454 TaxID=3015996 RepID=UPI0022B65C4D|nr:DUF3253 domain-containing protein [Caulobacter sp. NIBR2454]
MTSPIEDALLSAIALLPEGKSADPVKVAQSVEPERWRRILPHVRNVAIGLARENKLVILRHNKPADPGKFKGVWRYRALTAAEVAAGGPTFVQAYGTDEDGLD